MKMVTKVMEIKDQSKQMELIMGNETLSKSGKMKELFRLGLEVKQIASLMGVRYNFVYNVVSNMVIIEGIQVENVKTESKKGKVWELLDSGKSVKEIAIELRTNTQYIYKLSKEWKENAVKEVEKLEQTK